MKLTYLQIATIHAQLWHLYHQMNESVLKTIDNADDMPIDEALAVYELADQIITVAGKFDAMLNNATRSQNYRHFITWRESNGLVNAGH